MLLNNKLREEGLLPPGVTFYGTAPSNSVHNFFHLRTCNTHVAYRTRAAVRRNPRTLGCPLCSLEDREHFWRMVGRSRLVGKGELRLWQILHIILPPRAWSVQDRIRGWNGTIDACVYFPLQRWLCIQVDGITHSSRPMRGKPDSLITHARFEHAALHPDPDDSRPPPYRAYNVLRLPEKDSDAAWESAIIRAVRACMQPGAPAQVFSV